MPTSWFRIATLLLAIATAGCAGTPEAPTPSQGRIGVVSLLGDTLHTVFVGATVLTNENSDALVPDWGLDNEGRQQLLTALRESGHMADALNLGAGGVEARYRRDAGPRDEYAGLDIAALQEMGRQQGYATLVVLSRGTPVAGDPHIGKMLPGYGIYRRSVFGAKFSCTYTLADVLRIDVAQGKVVRRGLQPCKGWESGMPEFQQDYARYSPAEREILRGKFSLRLQERLGNV